MASKFQRPDSRFWWIKHRAESGAVVRKSSKYRVGIGIETRACEREVAQLTVQEKNRGLVNRSRHAFNEWVPGFLESTYANAPKTLVKYQSCWRALSCWMRSVGVHAPIHVQRHHAAEYVAWRTAKKVSELSGKRKVCRNSAIVDLVILRIIMYEAVKRSYIATNPIARLGLKLDRQREKPELTPMQIEQVREELKRSPEWMRTCFEVALLQGCRLAETSVPFSDVDMERETITFTIKRNRRHTTKLHPSLVPMLRSLVSRGYEKTCELPRGASYEFHRLFKRLGMNGLSFHCLRVTAITRLARAGIPEGTALRFIGHSSSAIHRLYQRLQVSDLSACVAALEQP